MFKQVCVGVVGAALVCTTVWGQATRPSSSSGVQGASEVAGKINQVDAIVTEGGPQGLVKMRQFVRENPRDGYGAYGLAYLLLLGNKMSEAEPHFAMAAKLMETKSVEFTVNRIIADARGGLYAPRAVIEITRLLEDPTFSAQEVHVDLLGYSLERVSPSAGSLTAEARAKAEQLLAKKVADLEAAKSEQTLCRKWGAKWLTRSEMSAIESEIDRTTEAMGWRKRQYEMAIKAREEAQEDYRNAGDKARNPGRREADLKYATDRLKEKKKEELEAKKKYEDALKLIPVPSWKREFQPTWSGSSASTTG